MIVTVTDWTIAPAIAEHGGHEHGLGTIVGYSVVETSWDDDQMSSVRRTQIAVYDGASAYGHALAVAKAQRTHLQIAAREDGTSLRGWCVVDTLYACGCRSDRVTA
jgi:hypothetical protein